MNDIKINSKQINDKQFVTVSNNNLNIILDILEDDYTYNLNIFNNLLEDINNNKSCKYNIGCDNWMTYENNVFNFHSNLDDFIIPLQYKISLDKEDAINFITLSIKIITTLQKLKKDNL